ncbi:RfbA dTDP-glucose pyrophosphorylase [Candidatus Nanopelagicaceae bacterium]
MKNIQLVIPAAGLGSRFADHGYTAPKPLIDVAGLPMIEWVIGNFQLIPGDTLIVVSRVGLNIQEEIAPIVEKLGVSVNFIDVPALTEGPAMTVAAAASKINMDMALVVANSDQYVSNSLNLFLNRLRHSSKEYGLILTMKASSNKWSYVGRTDNGTVTEVIEKVEISDEATVGIYGWSSAKLFFDSLEVMISNNDRTNGEFYVAPTYNYLIQKGITVETEHVGNVEDSVHGLGTVDDLLIFLENPQLKNYLTNVQSSLGILS